MDCEKFESTMIDELYEELDELTSAAAKRHVAGCARCATMLTGLRATRRLVRSAPPVVEPPSDLEDRILAATRDAQKVVPIKRRVSNAISWAGSWAMRPQTAMAALFLLMIGSSALLLRGKASKAPSSAAITVSEQGAPVASAVTGTVARPTDLESAQNAHGTPEVKRAAAPPPAQAGEALALAASSSPLGSGVAAGSGGGASPGATGFLGGMPASKAAMDETRRATAKDRGADPTDSYGGSIAAAPMAAAPAAPVAPAGPARSEMSDDKGAEGTALPKSSAAGSELDAAMAAFRAGSFDDATRQFDALASGGNVTAALWAARSVREGSGCSSAEGRFDQVAARAFGTAAGYDATLEGGRCYRSTGAYEAARARLVRLLTVKSHAARAQAELDAMAPKAAAKPNARAAPQAAPAKPADVGTAY